MHFFPISRENRDGIIVEDGEKVKCLVKNYHEWGLISLP
jgi:hypothetical protein